MRVLISGAGGFIGRALSRALGTAGHEVRRLVRRAPRERGEVAWDPDAGAIDARALAGCDAAVHLSGEPIDQRWTAAARRRIRDSRVGTTALLARALAGLDAPPRVLVSA